MNMKVDLSDGLRFDADELVGFLKVLEAGLPLADQAVNATVFDDGSVQINVRQSGASEQSEIGIMFDGERIGIAVV